jgi:hypothetical protein
MPRKKELSAEEAAKIAQAEWHFRDTRNQVHPQPLAIHERSVHQRAVNTSEALDAFDVSERGQIVRALKDQLAELTDFEFLTAVWADVSRRSIDEDPTAKLNPKGLTEAVFESLRALIGLGPFTPLAQRVAAVGRGALLTHDADHPTERIREIAEELLPFDEAVLVGMTREDYASVYASELINRFAKAPHFRNLYPQTPKTSSESGEEKPARTDKFAEFRGLIREALQRDSHSGRVTDVVIACGLEHVRAGGRSAVQNKVRRLLKGKSGSTHE